MKKFFSYLLILIMILNIGVFEASAKSYSCGENVTWSIEGNTLYIRGTGAMKDYSEDDLPFWKSQNITAVSIDRTVTRIGSYAFYGCLKLENIYIPHGIKEIGDYAFAYCTAIKSVYIPEDVEEIGQYAFTNNKALVDLHIDEGPEMIGQYAFANCTALQKLVLPNAVWEIDNGAFSGCSSLKTIFLSEWTERIGDSAFKDCTSLEKLVLPYGVERIEADAFAGCTKFNVITVPSTIKMMNAMSFGNIFYENNIMFKSDEPEKLAIEFVNSMGIEFRQGCIHVYSDPVVVREGDYEYCGRTEYTCTECGYLKVDYTDRLIRAGEVFTDLKDSDWYVKNGATNYVYTNGLFGGMSETSFGPKTAMDRGMFVTVLGRLAGAEVDKMADTEFEDVVPGKYYTGYVKWAADSGIVNGVSETRFSPAGKVTREQICKMIVEYSRVAEVEIKAVNKEIKFTDADKISKWAKEYVKTCQMAGIVNGNTNGTFAPEGNATRAEVATVFMNYCKGTLGE